MSLLTIPLLINDTARTSVRNSGLHAKHTGRPVVHRNGISEHKMQLCVICVIYCVSARLVTQPFECAIYGLENIYVDVTSVFFSA